MHPDKLGPLLVGRLRESQLDTDVVAEFAKVTTGTVEHWISTSVPPRGETLNRLWHLLEIAGIDSPELAKVSPFGRYLGRLMAFMLVSLEEAREMCGLSKPQGVLETIRGDRQPTRLTYDLEALQELYDTKLQEAIGVLRKQISAVSTIPEVAETQPPSTPTPEVIVPSANNEQFLLDLAVRLGALQPLVRHALDALTDEERARLRELVNFEVLFALSTNLNRLCSTRAFHHGGNDS